jgi:hypothetical protein
VVAALEIAMPRFPPNTSLERTRGRKTAESKPLPARRSAEPLESMRPIERVATSLIAFGVVLHTYEHAVEAEWGSVAFWLWSLSPYIVATIILVRFRHAHAATGALAVPVLLDLMTFFSVFVSPQGSTAALAMLFTPLWNLLVFVPLGAAVGRWVRNRSNADTL